VTKWELPKINSGETQKESYKSDTIVLITGTKRLPENLQDQVIDEITNLFPFDYVICDIPEDEYKKYHPKLVQMYKHYDTVQRLPKEYRYIIRIRNDVVLDEINVSNSEYRLLEENLKQCRGVSRQSGVVIGVQHLNTRRLTQKWRSRNRSERRQIGDFVIFHLRGQMMNPREIFNSSALEQRKLAKEPHWAWGDLFDVKWTQIVHMQLPLKIYRNSNEQDWCIGVKIPEYIGNNPVV
jgi:hypothetical protein